MGYMFEELLEKLPLEKGVPRGIFKIFKILPLGAGSEGRGDPPDVLQHFMRDAGPHTIIALIMCILCLNTCTAITTG